MSDRNPPVAAYHDALLSAAERAPGLCVVDVGLPAALTTSEFSARFPSRYLARPDADLVPAALERSGSGGPVFVGAPGEVLVGAAFPAVARSLVAPRCNVKLVGFPPEMFPGHDRGPAAFRDDLGAMRALPALTVVAPADAPTVRAATAALAERDGPAYLSLPPADSPTVTDGAFSVGRAQEMRAGSDLALLALGPMVAPALTVADELARAGVGVRVLDLASVKPLDEAAVLRAARDTGAILVAEAAPLATGLGTLVAAMTAENHPVPVRRLGLPDLAPDGPGLEELGLSLERMRDEAWELLRRRGRTT